MGIASLDWCLRPRRWRCYENQEVIHATILLSIGVDSMLTCSWEDPASPALQTVRGRRGVTQHVCSSQSQGCDPAAVQRFIECLIWAEAATADGL